MTTKSTIMQRVFAMPSAHFELDERIAAAVGYGTMQRYHMAHWKDTLVASDYTRLRRQGYAPRRTAETFQLIHDHETTHAIERMQCRKLQQGQ